MYKFKNSLIAIGALLLLVGAIALVTPRPTQGQVVDPVGPPKPVKVINTAAEPVPVAGTITGNVSISGTTSVNVANTPTVKIDPSNNTVQVARRGTVLLFDSGNVTGTGRGSFGPINIREYSTIRLFVLNRSSEEISVNPFSLTPGAVEGFRLGGFKVGDFGDKSIVYEVAGTSLFIDVFFGDEEKTVRVGVFGN